MKNVKKYLASILVVTILSNTVIVKTVSAAENGTITTRSVNKTEIVDKESKIIGEAIEKREKNVKHFLKEDLTYEADVYAYPVHYLNNGKWEEIDNTLEGTDDGQGNKDLKNKLNDFSVNFAQNSNSSKLVRLEKGKYKLSWGLNNAQKTDAQVKEYDETLTGGELEKLVDGYIESNTKYNELSTDKRETVKNKLIDNEKKRTINKAKSELDYKDIFPQTDLQYLLEGDRLKENIILKDKADNPSFEFDISLGNLNPRLEKDNTISFYDSTDNTKRIFQYQAPFMYDADGIESNLVKLELKENDGKYSLIITPDNAWLSDSSRKYPVVIDPPVNTSTDANSIKDTFVASNDTSDKYTNLYLRVGNNASVGVTRSYIKFDLPKISSSETIINSTLYLYSASVPSGGSQINAHMVTSSWNTPGVLWGNKPSYDSIVQDYVNVTGINQWSAFNITGITRDWYNSGINNGLMLKANNEAVGDVAFWSSDISGTNAGARPQVTIDYVNNSGLEDYWTYSQSDAGRAGTGYVNDFNGNLILIHQDLSMNGNRMPVSLQHVYNSNDKESSSGFGNGWRLNLSQRVSVDGTSGYYMYTDSDGTRHYFRQDTNGIYKDESGLDLTLTKNTDGSYTIKDKKDREMYFTPNGYLKTIKDSNGNTLTLNYYDTILLSVVDGAGRTTNLEYDTDPASPSYGYLKAVVDPSQRRTEFSYTNHRLTSVKYPDTKVTTYTYDDYNRLTTAVNFDGKKLNIRIIALLQTK